MKENRFLSNAQLRVSRADGAGPTISGYAAVFNSWAQIGNFRESIVPGAFAKAIARCDVRALFNHDSNFVLGRTSNRTLRLVEDDAGLAFTCALPDTSIGKDLSVNIARRDISGCSFSFTVAKDKWSADSRERQILEIGNLFDVGPVTFPAYEQTSVCTRSLWPDGIPADVQKHMTAARSAPKQITEEALPSFYQLKPVSAREDLASAEQERRRAVLRVRLARLQIL